MSNPAPGLKAALRLKVRAEMAKHSAAERAEASRRICIRLRDNPIWQNAKAVLLFAPLADEPDVSPLMSEAIALGKTLGLPRYLPDSGEYQIGRVGDLSSGLYPGQFGVFEPSASCPSVEVKHLDLVLVPGVAFSLAGGRLGRGRGFYDRLLAVVPGFKCGVAFDWQVAIEVPMEPHDIRVNCVLTPSRWHEVASQGRS
jgi:5-formyltetrahydrofolate cyclo-ligase